MKELRHAMSRIRRRVRRMRLRKGAALGACTGAALAACVCAAGFFLPIPHVPRVCGLLLLGGALAGGTAGLLWPVSLAHAARLGDAHGLQERLQTAMDCRGDSPMEQLLRQDALAAARAFPAGSLPMPKTRRLWLSAGAAALLCAGLCLVPNPQTAILAEQDARRQAMETAAQQAEALPLEETLTEKDRQEARKLVDELTRQLRQAREPVDGLLAVSQAEERLESLQSRMADEAQAALNAALQAQGLSALAQALEDGDAQQIAQALEGVSADALAQASQQLSQAMQGQLQQAAQALEAGDAASVAALLQAMGESAAASQLSSLKQGLSGLKNTDATGGAGRGTTNEDETADAEDISRGGGNANPRYRETQYERIYDPTRLDAQESSFAAQGPKGEGASMEMDLGPGAGSLDGTVPYAQVAQEYAQAAAQAAEAQSLTQQERQWVTDYFSALTE